MASLKMVMAFPIVIVAAINNVANHTPYEVFNLPSCSDLTLVSVKAIELQGA
jgi:hypothetical protein